MGKKTKDKNKRGNNMADVVEEKKSNVDVKVGIKQFCEEMQLSAYYQYSLNKSFGENVKKTKSEWKKYLVSKKLILEDVFN